MPDRQTPNIAAAGDALMASLAPTLPTPLETELADKLAAARRRIESLEMENERLRAMTPDALNRARYPDRYAPAATRPLTTADRPDVEVGDVLLRYGKTRMTVIAKRGCLSLPAFYRATDEERGEEVWCTNDPEFVYLSRADGGPVTVPIVPQNQAPAGQPGEVAR